MAHRSTFAVLSSANEDTLDLPVPLSLQMDRAVAKLRPPRKRLHMASLPPDRRLLRGCLLRSGRIPLLEGPTSGKVRLQSVFLCCRDSSLGQELRRYRPW